MLTSTYYDVTDIFGQHSTLITYRWADRPRYKDQEPMIACPAFAATLTRRSCASALRMVRRKATDGGCTIVRKTHSLAPVTVV